MDACNTKLFSSIEDRENQWCTKNWVGPNLCWYLLKVSERQQHHHYLSSVKNYHSSFFWYNTHSPSPFPLLLCRHSSKSLICISIVIDNIAICNPRLLKHQILPSLCEVSLFYEHEPFVTLAFSNTRFIPPPGFQLVLYFFYTQNYGYFCVLGCWDGLMWWLMQVSESLGTEEEEWCVF